MAVLGTRIVGSEAVFADDTLAAPAAVVAVAAVAVAGAACP